MGVSATSLVANFILMSAGVFGAANAASACDRSCLRQVVDVYFSALTARDFGMLPTTPSLKFTEDTAEKKPGEGLWADFTRVLDYRMDVLDPMAGAAVTFAVIESRGARALHVARIRMAE